MKKKDMKKMIEEIERLGVLLMDFELSKHIKLWVKNNNTGTIKLVTVSATPKCKGKYALVKSSVRKVFRKIGEEL